MSEEQLDFLHPNQDIGFDPSATKHGERVALVSKVAKLLRYEPDPSVIDKIERLIKEGKAKDVSHALSIYNDN